MIDAYRHLKPVHWLIAVAGALLLLFMQEVFPRGFVWLVNLMIILLASFLAFLILSGSRKILAASFALVVGAGIHAWEIRKAMDAGVCDPASGGWLRQLHVWQRCLDFADLRWLVEAQALILAGAFVVLVLSIPRIKSAWSFMRREYVLWRLRVAQARRRN